MLQGYLNVLKKRPLATKCITAGVLFASGDIIAQTLLVPAPHSDSPNASPVPVNVSKTKNTFDWQGLLSFSAFGCLFYAPSNHSWFAWMERSIATTKYYQTRPMLQALLRVSLHSVIYAPFSIICLFVWMGVTQGNSTSAIQASIAPHKIFPIWWTGGIFWIPTMLSIYRFVPLHLRVLATSTANVFWTTYLSYKKAAIVLDSSLPLPLPLPLDTSSDAAKGRKYSSR